MQVTIEMIHQALRALTVWKQNIPTLQLMNYIQRNYPVNPVEAELFVELSDKLKAAAVAGIIVETYEDCWSLSSALQKRHIDVNHVTLFWKIYADTMSPIKKKIDKQNIMTEDKGQNSDGSDGYA